MPLHLQRVVVKMATDSYDPALSKYTTLPAQFKVPSSPDLPAELHGSWVNVSSLRQAYRKNKLDPEIVEALDKVGFIWNVREHKWNMTIQGLQTFVDLHGHAIVPRSFAVPEGDERWPRETWNWKLGRVVDNLRLRMKEDLQPDRVAALNQLGFVWSVHELEWRQNLELLTMFKRLFGHVNVPVSFEVPADDDWPEYGHGARLGIWVQNARMRRPTYSESRQADLNSLGFIWAVHDESWQVNLRALHQYKALHGDVCVPKRFVTTDEWPEGLRGLHLGVFLHNNRSRLALLSPERRQDLTRLGVSLKDDDSHEDE